MNATDTVTLGPGDKQQARLGYGGSSFGPEQYTGKEDTNLLGAMERTLERGLTHFDTAAGYGEGHSERLLGRFVAAAPGRREQVYIASKDNLDDLSGAAMTAAIDASRERIGIDKVDLYYIHWPRTGKDMRPWMEALETARQQGKIGAIGVSNFSAEQMERISEAGRIDVCQLGYNLFWRYPERDLIPYCVEHGIAVVTFASLAQGILVGKFPRQPDFPEGDHRREILQFREDVWPHVYEGMEAMKAVAEREGRPLAHLAIRWLLHQPGVTMALVSARNSQQANSNADALLGEVSVSAFDELTAISDAAMRYVPDEGNVYGYHP